MTDDDAIRFEPFTIEINTTITPEQVKELSRYVADSVERMAAETMGLSAAASTATLTFADLKRTIRKFEDEFGPLPSRVEAIDWIKDLQRGRGCPDPFLVYSGEPFRVWPMFSFAGLARPDYRALYTGMVGGERYPEVSTVVTGLDFARIPRKSKKAIRKMVAGGKVSTAERRRCWRVLRGATIEHGRTR